MIYGRAVSRDGLAESIMRAHGFTVAQMVKLVRTGLASAPGAAGETLMDIAPHLRRELQHDQPFRRLAGPSSDQQVEIDLLQDVLCDRSTRPRRAKICGIAAKCRCKTPIS